MEWLVDVFTIEVLVGGSVLLLLGVWVLIRRWGRAPLSPRSTRTTLDPPDVSPSLLDLSKLVSHHRAHYPAFFRILSDFRRHHELEELIAEPELKKAFDCLAQRKGPPASPARRSYLRLEPDSGKSVQAAIVTLLRGIYQNPTYCERLSSKTHAEFDRLLDSLDKKPPIGIE